MGYFVIGLLFFCLGVFWFISGPMGFFLARQLSNRTRILEETIDHQSETLKKLSKLCQTIKGKLDEQERLTRLQQLSQQETPDLTTEVVAADMVAADLRAAEPSGVNAIAAGNVSDRLETAEPFSPFIPVETELVPAETVEPIKPATFFSEVTAPEGWKPPIEEVLPTAKEHAERREESHRSMFEPIAPTVTPPHLIEVATEKVAADLRAAERVAKDSAAVTSATTTSTATNRHRDVGGYLGAKPTDNTRNQWQSLELLIGRKVLPWVASKKRTVRERVIFACFYRMFLQKRVMFSVISSFFTSTYVDFSVFS